MALSDRLVDVAFGAGGLVVSTSGVTSTERLVCFVDTDTGGAGGAVTGWSLRASNGASADQGYIYTKNDLGPGDSTYTFTIGGGADGAAMLVAVDGSPDVDDAGANTDTGTSLVAPPVDVAEADGLLLCWWKIWSNSGATPTASITPPGGMDEVADNVDSNGWGRRSIYSQDVGSGSTGTRTATASSPFRSVSIAVALSAAVVGNPADLDVTIDGTTAQLTWSASPTPGVDDYLVFRRTPRTGAAFLPGTDTPVAAVAGTSYDDEDLTQGQYEWQVFGRNNVGS